MTRQAPLPRPSRIDMEYEGAPAGVDGEFDAETGEDVTREHREWTSLGYRRGRMRRRMPGAE